MSEMRRGDCRTMVGNRNDKNPEDMDMADGNATNTAKKDLGE